MNDKPFNIIKADYPEFYDWLKQISRYGKIEDHIIPDYKNGRVSVYFYTKEHCYNISARLPSPNGNKSENNNYGYLGCITRTRKPRAGEDWTRGNDLPDGKYNEETWNRIKNAIIAYELVKVVKLNIKGEVFDEQLIKHQSYLDAGFKLKSTKKDRDIVGRTYKK